MDNITIGHTIAKIRRLKDIKAFDIAAQLGMKEATYTRYERGETSITIDFLQKVSDVLKIDPLQILADTPSHFLENIHHSAIAIQTNSTFSSTTEQQIQLMLKLTESVVRMNDRLIVLLENKKG